MSSVHDFIQKTVNDYPIVLFMKGTAQFPQCGFSGKAIQLLKACGASNVATVNVLEDDSIRQGIKEFSQWPTVRKRAVPYLRLLPTRCAWQEAIALSTRGVLHVSTESSQ